MDDEDQLDAELNWQDPDPALDRRFFKTRPPGVNAMVAIAAVLLLAAIALYLKVRGGVSTDRGIRPLVELVVFCVICAIAAKVASRWVWVNAGSGFRTALRWTGALGPTPLIAILLVAAGVITVVLKARGESSATGSSFAETIRGGPLEGPDFVIRSDEAGRLVKTSIEEAMAFCSGKGAGWRLPRAGDEAFLTSRVTVKRILDGESIAAEPSPSEGPFAWSPTPGRFQRTLPFQAGWNGRPTTRFVVVCIRTP